ncbi:hypothetical protein [Kribbella sp. NPDC055071]
MLDPDEAFARRMFAAVPGLRAEMDDYQRRYVGDWAGPQSDAEQLLGFLVKLAHDCRRRSADERVMLRELFAFLDSELGHDEEIDALIEFYFAAYLPEPADRSGEILGLLGPELWEARSRQLLDDRAGVLESVVDFVFRLGEELPELQDTVDKHVQGRHSRLADRVLAEIATQLVAAGPALDVLPLLEFLEAEYGENPAIDAVIDVAFLELLPDPGQPGRAVVDLLGPDLRAQRLRMDPPAERPEASR